MAKMYSFTIIMYDLILYLAFLFLIFHKTYFDHILFSSTTPADPPSTYN